MRRQIHHDCLIYLTQVVAGEIDAAQGVILDQRFRQGDGSRQHHLIGSQVQVTEGVVVQQGLTYGLTSLISQTVETQV